MKLEELNETSIQMRAMERIRQIEQLEAEIDKLQQDGGHDDEIKELRGELALLKKERELNEMAKPTARWVKAPGPEKIGGVELQVKTDRGWSTVGFTTDKPHRDTLKVQLYKGSTGKMVNVDLNDYNIEK